MVSQREIQELEGALRGDLCRLAQFGANISDAHSCFIFLPHQLVASSVTGQRPSNEGIVELFACHTLSNAIVKGCRIPTDSGLIGWVARHHRSIHVSPFEHDSRTLGIYGNDQRLKSFIGIPVPLGNLMGDEGASSAPRLSGVLACDSKKSFAFSKLQGKLLEDLAREVAHETFLRLQTLQSGANTCDWDRFLFKVDEIAASLGAQSLEVLRLTLENFVDIERRIGTGAAIELLGQIQRLIEQSLPPNYPRYTLPCGDLILVLDQMMTGFVENRIRAMCEHVGSGGCHLAYRFSRGSFRQKGLASRSLREIMQHTALLTQQTRALTSPTLATQNPATPESHQSTRVTKGYSTYEYRRA